MAKITFGEFQTLSVLSVVGEGTQTVPDMHFRLI